MLFNHSSVQKTLQSCVNPTHIYTLASGYTVTFKPQAKARKPENLGSRRFATLTRGKSSQACVSSTIYHAYLSCARRLWL